MMRCPSSFFLVLGSLQLCLAPPAHALPQAPPPPVTVDREEVPVITPEIQSVPSGPEKPVRARSSADEPLAEASATVVSTWIEDAENGLASVIDGTSASYALIQSDSVAQGTSAFHLANPNFADNWFALDVVIAVQADTKLFFQSRLQYATTSQSAKVQVSHDGGATWPDTIHVQAGDGTSGEGVFQLREVDLGATYGGQQIMIRFYYEFTGGSAYTGTGINVGWLVDNIQIGSSFAKIFWSIGNPTASEVLFLEKINRARADALAEASRLANLTDPDVVGAYNYFGVSPSNIVAQFDAYVSGCMARFAQPMAFQSQLMETAQKHSLDMFNNQFQGHNSSSNPIAPFQPGDSFGTRLSRVGYSGAAGENVYAYADSVEHAHAGFDVDWGNTTDTGSSCYQSAFVGQGMQNPAGHRINIHNETFNEAGIGVVHGNNGTVGPLIVTQDFGSNSGVTYLTGLVYNDADANGVYSAVSESNHEGRGGVRVEIEGSAYYTTSTSSGAYALPLPEGGTHAVTFSADGMRTFSTTVVVAGDLNVKLDHQPIDLTPYEQWAELKGVTGGPLDDDDNDGVANLVESGILDMDPMVADAWRLPVFAPGTDGKMRLTINKRPGATDVSFEVFVSAELTSWSAAGTYPGATVEANTAAELTVAADAGLPKLFARIQLTLAP